MGWYAMGQVIDIEERRKARPIAAVLHGPSVAPLIVGLDVTLPALSLWRAWMAAWGSWWLAPLGLQMLPVQPSPPRVRHQDESKPGG